MLVEWQVFKIKTITNKTKITKINFSSHHEYINEIKKIDKWQHHRASFNSVSNYFRLLPLFERIFPSYTDKI